MPHFPRQTRHSRARCLRKKPRKNNPRMSKNYLESILLKVYVSDMDPDKRVEMLERALVIVAQSLAFDDRLSFREIVEGQEIIIRTAKVQAMEDMQIIPKLEDGQ